MTDNSYILPFSYRRSQFLTMNSSLFDTCLQKYATKEQQEIVQKIKEIPVAYKPVYGIKSTLNKTFEFEIYFYNYHPIKGIVDRESTISLEKLQQENIISSFTPNDTNYLMFSIDITNSYQVDANFYYKLYTTHTESKGYSTYKNIIQNTYYRYLPNSTPTLYKNIIDPKLINTTIYSYQPVFVGDKQYRNMTGIYYDGVSINNLPPIFYELFPISSTDQNIYCSIHMDYSKETETPLRYGIYGILC